MTKKKSLVDKFVRKIINDLMETAEDSVVNFILEHQNEIEKAIREHIDETVGFINNLLEKPKKGFSGPKATCEIHDRDNKIYVTIEYPKFNGYKVRYTMLNNNVLDIVLEKDEGGGAVGEKKEGN